MKFYPNRQALLNRDNITHGLHNQPNNNTHKIATAQDNHQNLFITATKILLVEDDPIIQRVHTLFLQQLGAKVELAKNGAEALRLFSQDYDLIFLDIGLPDLSGIEVARRIRAHEQTHGVKRNVLIALTAFGKLMKEECLAVGFDDFYTKPLPIEAFIESLKLWLPLQVKPELLAPDKLAN